MKNLLMIGAAAAALVACNAAVKAPADSGDVPAIDEAVTTAGAELEVESTYAGDCTGVEGEAPIINAVDRDDWSSAGLDLGAMDKRFEAGDDFFCHVNGAWYNNFEMPDDKTRYGSFTLLRDKSEARVKAIIEELAAAQPDAATLEGKVAAYYNAYLDTDAIEAAGLAPIQPYLDRIAAIESREDLAEVFAANGYSSPIGGWVDVDSKNTDSYIFYVTQGGLGLPDRDAYLNDEGKNVETREGYLKYLTLLLGEAGYADPAEAAGRVMALETEIAKAHWDRTVGRNRNLTYNKMSKADLMAQGGEFPVETMLAGLKISDQQEFVVRQVTPDAEEIAEAKRAKNEERREK